MRIPPPRCFKKTVIMCRLFDLVLHQFWWVWISEQKQLIHAASLCVISSFLIHTTAVLSPFLPVLKLAPNKQAWQAGGCISGSNATESYWSRVWIGWIGQTLGIGWSWLIGWIGWVRWIQLIGWIHIIEWIEFDELYEWVEYFTSICSRLWS